jgi:hypothetical protein
VILNSKVCARTQHTRFIQVWVTGVATLRPVWSSISRPALGVVPRRDCGCLARYPALLYIVQGRVPSRLHGRSPSRITWYES